MNAIVEPAFGIIPISLVRESITNPRKHFDLVKLQELASSIKTSGVGQPILVRPHPDSENNPDCVEIVAGARRYRASMLADMPSIPAIVRDMSDIEVLEFQLVENLQREDVHEIEEAEGYDRLMKEHNLSADQVAAKVGKSRSYIYGRLKLVGLAAEVRDACFDGTIEASTALLIARIPVPSLQVKAAQEIVHGYGQTLLEPMSYRRAKEHISTHYMLNFNRAPFAIIDATLVPAAGACGECPKRTGNQPEIYTDVGSPDVCTDSDCWFSKTTAHGERILKQAADKGVPIVEVKSVYEAGFEDASHGQTNTYRFDRVEKHGSINDLLPPEELPEPIGIAKTPDGKIHTFYKNDALQLALEKAGVCKSEEEEEQEAESALSPAQRKAAEERRAFEEARKSAAALETNIRVAAYRKVREGVIQQGLSLSILRVVAKSLLGDNTPPVRLLAKEYVGLDVQHSRVRDEKITSMIDAASGPEVAAIILDLITSMSLEVVAHEINDDLEYRPDEDDCWAQLLIDLADAENVDMEQIRIDLTNPAAEEHQEEPTTPVEPAVTPATEGKAKATYCHPDDPKLTWSGKGRQPKWLKEFLADGKSIEDLSKVEPAEAKTEALKPEAAWPFPRSKA